MIFRYGLRYQVLMSLPRVLDALHLSVSSRSRGCVSTRPPSIDGLCAQSFTQPMCAGYPAAVTSALSPLLPIFFTLTQQSKVRYCLTILPVVLRCVCPSIAAKFTGRSVPSLGLVFSV